jgi:Family of unknown function (DUF5752)
MSSVVGLGERLASLDAREFTSLSSLRSRLLQIVENFIDQDPKAREQRAESPFFLLVEDCGVAGATQNQQLC